MSNNKNKIALKGFTKIALRQTAKSFLALDPLSPDYGKHKLEILTCAKALIQGARFTSVAQAFKVFGISYFLGVNSSSKTIKGLASGYDTLICYLASGSASGRNFCPKASAGCLLACLVGAGRMPMGSNSVSRLIKSWIVSYRRDLAIDMMRHNINQAIKRGRKFAVRLNGTSDLPFDDLMSEFPSVQFYDYTKVPHRYALNYLNNYYVTFSYSESNWPDCREAYKAGFNIAIPVTKEAHKTLLGDNGPADCFQIDSHDLRFLDREENPAGRFGILTAKLTKGTGDGIDKGFIADEARALEFISYVKG